MSKQTELAQVADTITVNSGNVGIGKDSPAVKLDVDGTVYIRSNGILGLYNTDNTNQYQIYNGGSSGTNIGQLVFTQGGVAERMRIDAAGRVTTPSQPYFNVTKNDASYTLGNNDTFVFNRVMSNIGSHYNSSTGRFTAPVAGKYLFIFQTILIGAYASAAIKYYKITVAFTEETFTFHLIPHQVTVGQT